MTLHIYLPEPHPRANVRISQRKRDEIHTALREEIEKAEQINETPRALRRWWLCND